ncbi:MAG: ribonuclease HII [Lachnospiraceae bacterium]|nr:ribonuclease HII [Lachnospiraceae bacterium]
MNPGTKRKSPAQISPERLARERERLYAMGVFEREFVAFTHICGVDEAGRGPLAGPVVAGAVILPKDCEILFLNDSKKLSPSRRETLYDKIREVSIAWQVGVVTAARVDEINILQATYEAMRIAIHKLEVTPDILLCDAVEIPGISIKQVPIIGGDAKSVSIAAASVMAKVTRDRMMVDYDRLYPGYGFAKHKGYGTQEHIEKILEMGPCPIHRRSFIRNLG